MTAPTAGVLHFDLAPRRRPRRRPQWRRAWRAMRRLIRNKDDTMLAFQVVNAIDPDFHERRLVVVLAHPEGRRVFAAQPSLKDVLTDRARLARMAAGSFGRAYLEHIDRYRLDPGKLVALSRESGGETTSPDPAVRWMAERSSLAHDLWHVLTGYGADAFGEAALLLFSLGQGGGRANALLSLGANVRVTQVRGPGWLAYGWRAWRRGRRAVCLSALPYEELLPLPLGQVRAAAGIEPPERAHPGGIVRDA